MRHTAVVDLSAQLFYPRLISVRERRHEAQREHEAIWQTLHAGDPQGARQLAWEHISGAMALI
jgi:DNA-binding FadR family transcriptional regulator